MQAQKRMTRIRAEDNLFSSNVLMGLRDGALFFYWLLGKTKRRGPWNRPNFTDRRENARTRISSLRSNDGLKLTPTEYFPQWLADPLGIFVPIAVKFRLFLENNQFPLSLA